MTIADILEAHSSFDGSIYLNCACGWNSAAEPDATKWRKVWAYHVAAEIETAFPIFGRWSV